METDNIINALPLQVTLSPRAARDSQLRSRLDELNDSLQIQVSEAACRTGVNIAIVGEHPQAPHHCILVSATATEDDQRHALKSGAAALITPAITPTELKTVIAAVHHGFAVIPSQLAPHIAQRLQTPPRTAPITTTQRQLLQLLATGNTLKGAAAATGYSERQARRHLRQLWDTLKTPNQTAGIIQATRYGLIPKPPHPQSNSPVSNRGPTKNISRLQRRTGHIHTNDTGRRPDRNWK